MPMKGNSFTQGTRLSKASGPKIVNPVRLAGSHVYVCMRGTRKRVVSDE